MFVPQRHTQNVSPPPLLTLLFSTLNELSLIHVISIQFINNKKNETQSLTESPTMFKISTGMFVAIDEIFTTTTSFQQTVSTLSLLLHNN